MGTDRTHVEQQQNMFCQVIPVFLLISTYIQQILARQQCKLLFSGYTGKRSLSSLYMHLIVTKTNLICLGVLCVLFFLFTLMHDTSERNPAY